MPRLILYWNELSFPNATSIVNRLECKSQALATFGALDAVFRICPDARVSVAKGAFHAIHEHRTLLAWLESWLGVDRLRRLKGRAIQPGFHGDVDGCLLCEVKVEGAVGSGLTRAYLADTWIWSFGSRDLWIGNPIVRGDATVLQGDNGLFSRCVDIRNVASEEHAHYWRNSLLAWGAKIAASSTIGYVDEMRVMMYPLDHGLPHVHMVDRDGNMYKYRIDAIEALDGAPLEREVGLLRWIVEHRECLLESWRRCQQGMRPLRVDS